MRFRCLRFFSKCVRQNPRPVKQAWAMQKQRQCRKQIKNEGNKTKDTTQKTKKMSINIIL